MPQPPVTPTRKRINVSKPTFFTLLIQTAASVWEKGVREGESKNEALCLQQEEEEEEDGGQMI